MVARSRIGRIPSLDGLRGGGIMLVIGAHLSLSVQTLREIPHYYAVFSASMAITVFFTLSGYLITTLLLREEDKYGKIDVKAFSSAARTASFRHFSPTWRACS